MKTASIICRTLLCLLLFLSAAACCAGGAPPAAQSAPDGGVLSGAETPAGTDQTPAHSTAPEATALPGQMQAEPLPSTPSQMEPDPASAPQDTPSREVSLPDGGTYASSVPAPIGQLQVRGSHLTDAAGNPVQLRGVSTHGLAWYPEYVNEDCFRQLRQEWNVNVIRLAMYTEEYGGYCSGGDQTALKNLIDMGVTAAARQGLYVIIDWHILSDGDPNRHIDEAKAFFQEMSSKYAGCSHVLYEICNEPNGGVGWSRIKSYAEAVIPVIRANAPEAVILVGTPNWSQYVDQAAADPITGYDNIMYTLHFYAATHRESLRNTLTAAVEKGLPVFVSEFGICDASGSGGIDRAQANAWIETLDRLGVSYVAWNLSNKAETSALLQGGCEKTFGFTGDDLSESGKWLYQTLTGGAPAASQPAGQSSVPPAEPPAELPQPVPEPAPSAGTLSCTASVQNQWENNGQTYLQYAVSVHNNTDSDCESWRVSLTFSGGFSLSDSWNGEYAAGGNTLTISSLDYNGVIPAGGSAENIGFIISGAPGLALASCS